jgi:hypothetical protein
MNDKIEMTTIPDPKHLKKYYKGVLDKIKIEIERTSELVDHPGIKGSSNEEVIRDLLIRFLPRRYSVGSGIIYDRAGSVSKQVDLIIYDSFYHPNIYNQGAQPLFPVDIVYCAIEIKTQLDLDNVTKNIQSIKNLKIIKKDIMLPNGVVIETNSPYGIIFSYNYDREINNFDTIKERIKRTIQDEPDKHSLFDMCYVMTNTFFVRNPNLDDSDIYECSFCVTKDEDILANSDLEINADGLKWKCDQSLGFLMFLIDLLTLLSHKHLINEYIFNHYLNETDFYRYCDTFNSEQS